MTTAGYPLDLKILLHTVGSTQKVALGYKSYLYPHADTGFAEARRETYDKASAGLAWSRTLGVVRSTFGIQVDLKEVWENHLACKRYSQRLFWSC